MDWWWRVKRSVFLHFSWVVFPGLVQPQMTWNTLWPVWQSMGPIFTSWSMAVLQTWRYTLISFLASILLSPVHQNQTSISWTTTHIYNLPSHQILQNSTRQLFIFYSSMFQYIFLRHTSTFLLWLTYYNIVLWQGCKQVSCFYSREVDW